jgi:hypothetical protein
LSGVKFSIAEHLKLAIHSASPDCDQFLNEHHQRRRLCAAESSGSLRRIDEAQFFKVHAKIRPEELPILTCNTAKEICARLRASSVPGDYTFELG